MIRFCAFAIFASGIVLSSSAIDDAFSVFQSEIDKEIVAASRQGSDTRLRRQAAEAYERLFGARLRRASLKDFSSADLDLVLRAAEIAGTYAPGERPARDMAAIVEELERRGDAANIHYTAAYRMLVAVRDLAGARRLAAKYPAGEFEVLPAVRADPEPARAPSVWVPGETPHEVVQRRVDLGAGPGIVVVSHPSCHFSRNAVSAIAADDVLGPTFRSHATWIAPQSGTLDLPVLQRWNREHRDFAVALAVRQAEWPFVDYWNTPTFYFLKDGTVVEKVIGWPKEGRREELLAASRKAGLLRGGG
jgi:hypothetical protein